MLLNVPESFTADRCQFLCVGHRVCEPNSEALYISFGTSTSALIVCRDGARCHANKYIIEDIKTISLLVVKPEKAEIS